MDAEPRGLATIDLAAGQLRSAGRSRRRRACTRSAREKRGTGVRRAVEPKVPRRNRIHKEEYMRSAVWGTAALLILTLWVVPARAELSDAELEVVKQLARATESVRDAEKNVARAIEVGTTDATTRQPLGEALGALVQSSWRLTAAFYLLLGDRHVRAGDNGLEGEPRDVWVARAWRHVDDTQTMYLVRADRSLASIQGERPRDTTYQSAIASARATIGLVQDALHGVDRSGVYADPTPVTTCPAITTRVCVFGPHGDWRGLLDGFANAAQYAHGMAGDVAAGYRAQRAGDEVSAVWFVVHRYDVVLTAQLRAVARLAGVRFGAEDLSDDVVARVLKDLQRLTVGVPNSYHDGFVRLKMLIQSATGRRGKYEHALGQWSDSWRHNDFGVWFMLTFPERGA
jgi:hypothetical protein